MRLYAPTSKHLARDLRSRMTEAEQALWSRLRRRQVEGVRFLRQKPIAGYIVDFFAPRAALVVEVDGGQHWTPGQRDHDRCRDEVLRSLGLRIVRYSNLEVLQNLDAVVADVRHWLLEGFRSIGDCRSRENPP